LIDLQARIEASLDFSDEGDVADDLAAGVLRDAATLREEIRAVLADDRRGERLREGLTIAIAGPPNAGKSTLFNWLAGREAAIVSPYPGTTRDVLEVHLELDGYPVTVLDTAGVRPSSDPVEQEGIARARARAVEADLVLWVEDVSAAGQGGGEEPAAAAGGAPVWRVLNKADLADAAGRPVRSVSSSECAGVRTPAPFVVSARTGMNLSDLMAALTDFARDNLGAGEGALITRERHRHVLNQALYSLDEIMNINSFQEDLIAENLRGAAAAIGRLVGRIDVEDILDAVFRDFCIGK
jgi:tRNA modification GTPase